MIFTTNQDLYQVIGTDCCLISGERMRIETDGTVSFRDTSEPVERYKFQTEEVARIFVGILNRDLQKNSSIVSVWQDVGFTGSINTNLVYRSAGREVIALNQYGGIERLDLPWIVWTWLKLSAAGKLVRAIWYGQRG